MAAPSGAAVADPVRVCSHPRTGVRAAGLCLRTAFAASGRPTGSRRSTTCPVPTGRGCRALRPAAMTPALLDERRLREACIAVARMAVVEVVLLPRRFSPRLARAARSSALKPSEAIRLRIAFGRRGDRVEVTLVGRDRVRGPVTAVAVSLEAPASSPAKPWISRAWASAQPASPAACAPW